jgi:hypothetical protein
MINVRLLEAEEQNIFLNKRKRLSEGIYYDYVAWLENFKQLIDVNKECISKIIHLVESSCTAYSKQSHN